MLKTLTLGLALAAASAPALAQVAQPYDIVILEGRVIDPETGLDAIRNVAIRDDEIALITEDPIEGELVINATGLVVAPGFIDLTRMARPSWRAAFRRWMALRPPLSLRPGFILLRTSMQTPPKRAARSIMAPRSTGRPPATRC